MKSPDEFGSELEYVSLLAEWWTRRPEHERAELPTDFLPSATAIYLFRFANQLLPIGDQACPPVVAGPWEMQSLPSEQRPDEYVIVNVRWISPARNDADTKAVGEAYAGYSFRFRNERRGLPVTPARDA